MRSLISILLAFSFLTVSVSKSIILVNYELNKKEITEKYCVNKDKPQMHCCGKCMLKKKLAEQEEQQKYPLFPDIKTDVPLVSEVYKVCQIYKVQKVEWKEFNNPSVYFIGKSIFHPPSVV